MTQDEIIKMARKAGYSDSQDWSVLVRFAQLVADYEREGCIDALLKIANQYAGNPYKQALRMGVETIRARK